MHRYSPITGFQRRWTRVVPYGFFLIPGIGSERGAFLSAIAPHDQCRPRPLQGLQERCRGVFKLPSSHMLPVYAEAVNERCRLQRRGADLEPKMPPRCLALYALTAHDQSRNDDTRSGHIFM